MGAGSEVAGRWGLDRSRESWAGRGLSDCARVAVRSDLRRLALGRATDRMALRVCPAGTGARPRGSARGGRQAEGPRGGRAPGPGRLRPTLTPLPGAAALPPWARGPPSKPSPCSLKVMFASH